MSANSRRKAVRYGKASRELRSGSEGSGMNPVPLQRALSETPAGVPEQHMNRRAPVRHKSHHKYDESSYLYDHAMAQASHLVGR